MTHEFLLFSVVEQPRTFYPCVIFCTQVDRATCTCSTSMRCSSCQLVLAKCQFPLSPSFPREKSIKGAVRQPSVYGEVMILSMQEHKVHINTYSTNTV